MKKKMKKNYEEKKRISEIEVKENNKIWKKVASNTKRSLNVMYFVICNFI